MASFLAVVAGIFSVVLAIDYRKEEFDRINKYELVSFNLSQSPKSNILSFNAFGNHYEVSLTANEYMNPSTINHTNGNLALKEGLEPFYTHLTESCHYFGEVAGSNGSSVAISICDQRGIRGSISAFAHTLSIKPAKYFDAEFDRNNYHQHTDEHLVYRMADFDNSDLPKGRGKRLESSATPKLDNTKVEKSPIGKSSKRRLIYNNGNNVLEVYSFVDKYYSDQYKSEYFALNWYDVMVADFADLWHGVSEEYRNPKFCECPKAPEERCQTDADDRNCYYDSWSSELPNGISLNWVALEVATHWNGKYMNLKPKIYDGGNGNLGIDSGDYLGKFKQFIADNYFANGNVPDFDQASVMCTCIHISILINIQCAKYTQGFTGDDPETGAEYDTGGIAWKGVVWYELS